MRCGRRISEHADSVPEGTAATFTVTLSSTPPGVESTADVVVVYTLGGTATSADYTAPSDLKLTIDSGESSGTITIPTSTDSVLDPGETIVVTLTSASTAGTVTVDPTAVTTTLVEEGTETVSVAAATATEGAAANFVVTLSGAVSSAVEVSYQTSDGTAVAGSDYTGADDTLTFSVGGSLQQTIAVDTTDDTLNEATEDFTLTLTLDYAVGRPESGDGERDRRDHGQRRAGCGGERGCDGRRRGKHGDVYGEPDVRHREHGAGGGALHARRHGEQRRLHRAERHAGDREGSGERHDHDPDRR